MTDTTNRPGPPSLRMGDRGPAVRDLQRRLARQGGDLSPEPPPVTGVFSEETARLVQVFQRQRGLAADGVVGPETWRALVEAGYSLGDRLLWRSRVMMRGDDVRELQHRLNQLGFDAGGEDGIFGPLAQTAVEEFQRNTGLDVDGVAGTQTVAMLRRLHRTHQTGGAAVRVREREALRRLARRGLLGSRILVDPARGPAAPGQVGPSGVTEHEATWSLAAGLVGHLRARGAVTLLSRGPTTTPSASSRARFANDQAVDVVISIATNGLANRVARGCAAYYFGAPHFVSESGRRLADLALDELVARGWDPDCRTHPMTWAILRETRMPAVVVEPGFLTSPRDAAKLAAVEGQRSVAEALVAALSRFLDPLGVVRAAG